MSTHDSSMLFSLMCSWGLSQAHFPYGTDLKPMDHDVLTDVLLDQIRLGNPWEKCPRQQAAAVDLLPLVQGVSAENFAQVLHAVFSHPAADPPETWSVRPSLIKTPGYQPNRPTLPFLHALAKSSLGSAGIESYCEAGGRLDVYDINGRGVLALLHDQEERWKSWFQAAQKQQVDLTKFPSGEHWAVIWKNEQGLTGTLVSKHQKTIADLLAAYPPAPTSPAALEEHKWQQWLTLVEAAPGQRALAGHLKASKFLLERIQSNPSDQIQLVHALLRSLLPHIPRLSYIKDSVERTLFSSLGWGLKILDGVVVDAAAQQELVDFKHALRCLNPTNAYRSSKLADLLSSPVFQVKPWGQLDEMVSWMGRVGPLIPENHSNASVYFWTESKNHSWPHVQEALMKGLCEPDQDKLMASPESLTSLCQLFVKKPEFQSQVGRTIEDRDAAVFALLVGQWVVLHDRDRHRARRAPEWEGIKAYLENGNADPSNDVHLLLNRGLEALSSGQVGAWDVSVQTNFFNRSSSPSSARFQAALLSQGLKNALSESDLPENGLSRSRTRRM